MGRDDLERQQDPVETGGNAGSNTVQLSLGAKITDIRRALVGRLGQHLMLDLVPQFIIGEGAVKADEHFKNGRLHEGLRAYARLGIQVPSWKIVGCGDVHYRNVASLLERGAWTEACESVGMAVECYVLAHDDGRIHIMKDGLREAKHGSYDFTRHIDYYVARFNRPRSVKALPTA